MGIDKIRRTMMFLCLFFAFMAFTTGHMIMTFIALAFAFAIKYIFGGSFNDRNANDKEVTGAENLTLYQIYEAIKDIETPLGHAYMGDYDKLGTNVIIIGPGVFKDHVVIYKDKDTIRLHSSCAIHHIKNVDESRFDKVIDTKGLEVTTKRFSSFVSYKVMTAVLLMDLTAMIEGIKNGVMPTEKSILDFNLYHYDSHDYVVRDIDDNEFAVTETYVKPLSVTVYDMNGEVVATVTGDSNKMREGFRCTMSGEEYGTFYRTDDAVHDGFYIDTPDGQFVATAFRVIEDGRVSCNYRVSLDGVDKAVIASSKKVEFDEYGYIENDVICSMDDDYLVVYIAMLDFIMCVNTFTRH